MMRKIRKSVFTVFLALLISRLLPAQQVFPSEAQVNWAESEIGVLIHFDMPVFEPSYDFRKDWNYHPDLSIFNPKELDTDQWIRSAKAA
jgi:alpha-L-fucosidase